MYDDDEIFYVSSFKLQCVHCAGNTYLLYINKKW